MREELARLAWRGAEEGFRLTLVGAKLAVDRAEKAGLDVSAVRSLLDSGSSRPAERAPVEAGPPRDGLYEGRVRVEVGPLDQYSQLAEFEDAANEIGAANEITVESFSHRRATLALDLAEPTNLVQELETHAPFPITIRHTGARRVVLDVPGRDKP